MSLRPWEVQRFEGLRPGKRPAEIAGSRWHGETAQAGMPEQCWRCREKMLPGATLIGGRWCGPCAAAFDLPPAA